MSNPNNFDHVVFLIPRDVVEQQDLDFMLSGLGKLLADEKTIRLSKDKVTIGFDGYDDDAREVYEVQEIREYIKAVTLRFPHWFYFCSKQDHTLWILLMAQCRFRKFGPGVAKVLTEDAEEIYSFLLTDLLEFCKKNNLSEKEFASTSLEISKYFETQRIPIID